MVRFPGNVQGSAVASPGHSALAFPAHGHQDCLLPGYFGEELKDGRWLGGWREGTIDHTTVVNDTPIASYLYSTTQSAPLATMPWNNNAFSTSNYPPQLAHPPIATQEFPLSDVSHLAQRDLLDLQHQLTTETVVPPGTNQTPAAEFPLDIFSPEFGNYQTIWDQPQVWASNPSEPTNDMTPDWSSMNSDHVLPSALPCFGQQSTITGPLSVPQLTPITGQATPFCCSSSAPSTGDASKSNGEPLYSCPDCGKLFSTRVQLKRHEKRHTKRYFCRICNTGFSTSSELRRHTKKRSHGGGKVFRCPRCPETFTRVDNLQRHDRKKHTG